MTGIVQVDILTPGRLDIRLTDRGTVPSATLNPRDTK